MKTTIKKVALIIAATGCFAYANAQKIAHVSLDSLMSAMPETKIAKDAAQSYLNGINQEVITMQTELETKYKDYLDKEPTMSEPVKQNKQQDLQQLQKRIEDFKTQAGQDYQRKQAELGAPILEKARKGIEAVAKEGGYKYVLDASPNNGTILYSEPSDDIFAAVKKKLDAMPPANIPGANPTPKTPPGKGGAAPNKAK
jgi:outer membrane protein